MAEDELMALLSQKPVLFEITRDKILMQILKELYEGGKTATYLADKYKIGHDALAEKLAKLVEEDVLDKFQKGDHFIYFLGVDGVKLIELYFQAKEGA